MKSILKILSKHFMLLLIIPVLMTGAELSRAAENRRMSGVERLEYAFLPAVHENKVYILSLPFVTWRRHPESRLWALNMPVKLNRIPDYIPAAEDNAALRYGIIITSLKVVEDEFTEERRITVKLSLEKFKVPAGIDAQDLLDASIECLRRIASEWNADFLRINISHAEGLSGVDWKKFNGSIDLISSAFMEAKGGLVRP